MFSTKKQKAKITALADRLRKAEAAYSKSKTYENAAEVQKVRRQHRTAVRESLVLN